MTHEIDHDALWPRDEAHRFRVYGCIAGDLTVLSAAPTPGGIGQALVSLHADQKELGRRLADLGRIGVLDVLPDPLHPRGDWIVLPYDRGGPAW